MLPPHPPMAEGPGGPMYNGLHTADPAWSPIIKVVPNSDNSDPQQVLSCFMLIEMFRTVGLVVCDLCVHPF